MSRWPWVSREAFDLAIESRDREHENAMVLRRELSTVTARLLSFSAPPTVTLATTPPATVEAVAPKPLSPVAQIIREQTVNGGRTDHALASHLRNYAQQLKLQGKTEDEIVGALVEWQTSELSEVE